MINGKIVKIPNEISEYYLIEITVVLSFNVSAAPFVGLQNKQEGLQIRLLQRADKFSVQHGYN